MLRPSLVACPDCACHVRATEEACPHCDAPLAGAVKAVSDPKKVRRAAVAVSLGLAVGVAQLAACDDTTGSGGAGGATSSSGSKMGSSSSSGSTATSGSTTGSDSSSIAAYGVAGTSTGVGSASSGGN